jgi:Bardet-Biedl syndrome 4 protein
VRLAVCLNFSFSPENPELLTTIGLLYLRIGDNFKAFDYLGNSLTHDPKNPKVTTENNSNQ